MENQEIKITHVESELYQWDKPPIWNGLHVYDKGRLHLVRVRAAQAGEKRLSAMASMEAQQRRDRFSCFQCMLTSLGRS